MPKGNAQQTEEQIRREAVRLFNEQGYANVSLRDIAKAAGTTIGNMTYHFSKKEDLVLRIVEGLHQEFEDTRLTASTDDPLRALVESLLAAEVNRVSYPFYFLHMNQVVSSSPALLEKSRTFQTRLFDNYCRCLRDARAGGLLAPTTSDATIECLATLIILVVVSWAQPVSPGCNDALPQMSMTEAAASLLEPYLTERGTERLAQQLQATRA